MATRLERDQAAGIVLAVLAFSNVVANRVLPEHGYVPWNLTLTAGLAEVARRADVGSAELGLDRASVGRGVRVGALAAGAVAIAYGVALKRDDGAAFRDDRVARLTVGQVRFHTLVRIPLGTAVAEEFAFRAVVPALVRRPGMPAWAPAAVSSVLFGLWHLLPSRELAAANDAVDDLGVRIGPWGVRALAVTSTAVAGGALTVLRAAGGHLAAPVLAHWASNALGLLAARSQHPWPTRDPAGSRTGR